MGSNTFITLITILMILLPTIAMAKEIIVGDDSGWTTNFDYADWAKDKVFRVGDTLVFKYKAGNHNVFKVDGTGFQECTIPAGNEAPLTSGNDKIELKTTGNKWYICGVTNHCADLGQRLKITVVADESSSAVPVGIVSSFGYQVFMVAIIAVIALVA